MHPPSACFPSFVSHYFKTTNANLKLISILIKNQPRLQCHSNSRASAVHSSHSGIPWKGQAPFPGAGMLSSTSQLVLLNPSVWPGWGCFVVRGYLHCVQRAPIHSVEEDPDRWKKEEEWWKSNEGDSQKPNFSFVFCIFCDEMGCCVLCAAVNGCPSAPACPGAHSALGTFSTNLSISSSKRK